MPEVAFVMSPGQDASLRELAETVGYELELQGVPSSLHLDGFPEPRPGLLYILVGLRQFLAAEGEASLPDPTILGRTVMLGAEPPGSAAHGERYRELLRQFGVVFDVSLRSVVELHRLGIRARTLRPGYSALRDRFDAGAERPIDIAFFGVASARRQRLLADYAPVLSRYNCVIQLADPSFPNAQPGPSFLGPERHAVLAASKLALSLHAEDRPDFDWAGALDAIHAGAVVVSEHAHGIAPFDVGQHVVVAGPQALAYVAEELLRDVARQQAVREAAYERLSHWIPFGLSVGVLRAALVELVGQPVRAEAPLGRPPQPAEAQAERRARWTPRQEAGGGSVDVHTRAALGAELVALRRQLSELTAQTLAGEPPARVITESPGWEARRRPRTSVIVLAGADPQALAATLDSLLAGRDPDLELVVAGAENSALALAGDVCARHPRMAIRVLGLRVNRGAGADRNLAVEHVRGRALLMVSGGDVLFPRALSALAAALEAAEDVALTYGIAASRDGQREPELTSFYGWEPGRLRLGNFIQGPYLVRAETLVSLGGYSEDAALAGWEDYDLFCRLAESPWRGELVPQPIASLMSRGTLAPECVPADPVRGAALVRRAPGLLAGLSAV